MVTKEISDLLKQKEIANRLKSQRSQIDGKLMNMKQKDFIEDYRGCSLSSHSPDRKWKVVARGNKQFKMAAKHEIERNSQM